MRRCKATLGATLATMINAMTEDAQARLTALDPARSFAVRAPAGSGKTTLLTQRVLRLLTTVDHPEQIVAITFTRKAAEEMRSRILDALELATCAPPDDQFLRHTFELAVAASNHDRLHNWDLPQHPTRLRIMTIDALSQSLVRQMPITARMPGLPTVEEDLRQLYREAAREALAEITEAGALRHSIARAMHHFDNDWGKLEALVAEMLAKRDQWLPLVSAGSDREVLALCFERTVAGEIATLLAQLPPALAQELGALSRYAASHLDPTPLTLAAPSTVVAKDLSYWQPLCRLFLTGQFEWRRRVDKRDGFPAAGDNAKPMKQRWADAAATLALLPRVQACMVRILRLPQVPYEPGEWDTVSALVTLIKSATAHLMVLCEQGGRSDFTAFSMAALVALGEPERPTDLALTLDYQLRHLLIDEFQDTSITQYELISRLTAGWEVGDGRTLFLVGDPMQSIYRFRQADVSLFRRVLEDGHIGGVRLEPLTLVANFRAQARLVAWVNDAMPLALAAIAAPNDHFVTQTAVRSATSEPCVLHAYSQFDASSEALQVQAIVAALREAQADASIAILVRSRTHLGQIATTLMDAGISVAAREITPFTELPLIADLMALARALLHDADRVAWFALLRAPWCGLKLQTLHQLASRAPTLWQALASAIAADDFDCDEYARMARVHGAIESARKALRNHQFAEVLEQTWLALSGPALLTSAQSSDDARAFFLVIDALERDGIALTAERIANRIRDRYSTPRSGSADAVQIMTIHRAKGLEFDHVIIPGLGRPPRGDSRPLLLWRKDIDEDGAPNLLLAPVPLKGKSALYDYLRARESSDSVAEIARVLYVALTRARHQVHLLAHAECSADGTAKPAKGSFLGLLWPILAADFLNRVGAPQSVIDSSSRQHTLRRVMLESLPAASPTDAFASYVSVAPQVEFDWAGVTAKHVGTVTHQLLQDLAARGSAAAHERWLDNATLFARGRLRALGVAGHELETALGTLKQALLTTLNSDRGRWLFSSAHRDARTELCLASAEHRTVGRIIIDRTFVDGEDRRWIIDFKTGSHSGGGREAYLDAEVQRYRPQLERYGAIMTALDPRPTMLALYFPLLDGWREWPYQATIRAS